MTMKLNQATLLKNQAFINGAWIGAQSGKTFAVTNPATGAVIVAVAGLVTANVLPDWAPTQVPLMNA